MTGFPESFLVDPEGQARAHPARPGGPSAYLAEQSRRG